MRRLVVLALLLALAGCGASTDSATEFDGAQRDVARAVEDLEEAAQEDDPQRICQALLSTELAGRLGTDCAAKIQRAIDQADTFALTVESVRVTGDTARARVETGLEEENVETLELVREDRAWKIAGLPAG